MADADKSAEKPLSGEEIEALPIKERVNYRYQHAQGSIQDIARVYRLSVEEVLHMLGMDDMSEIQTQGDLIDQAEAGPLTQISPYGKPAKANYTLD